MQMNDFVNRIVELFQENLLAILQYGSSVHSTHPADVDIIVVLRKKCDTSADLSLLATIIQQFSGIYFDLQLQYAEEIGDEESFSLDSHGCFFVSVLKSARLLWGTNPFDELSPSRKQILHSVVRKLQYYVFRARQMYLGEPYRSKDRNNDFHRKKILMAMSAILLLDADVPSRSPLCDFTTRYPDYLTPEECSLIGGQNETSLSITQALPIYEKLYSLSLQLYMNIGDET